MKIVVDNRHWEKLSDQLSIAADNWPIIVYIQDDLPKWEYKPVGLQRVLANIPLISIGLKENVQEHLF